MNYKFKKKHANERIKIKTKSNKFQSIRDFQYISVILFQQVEKRMNIVFKFFFIYLEIS